MNTRDGKDGVVEMEVIRRGRRIWLPVRRWVRDQSDARGIEPLLPVPELRRGEEIVHCINGPDMILERARA